MKSLFHVFVAFFTAMLLAACGGRGALMPTAGSAPYSNRQASTAEDGGGGPTLYVSGNGGTAIFAAGGAKYLRKIRPKTGPVTTDSSGHLYVAGEAATTVDVYENRGAKLAWKIHTKPYYPRQLNLDDLGDLYVNCGDSNLCEYGPHTKGLIRQFRGSGSLLALDAAGNLYLAAGLHAIAIYAPGSSSPERTITNGINYPQLLALDPQGNLYVANEYAGSQRAPNVTIYAPGASSPTRTITSGLTTPWAMTTDSASNLYVLNECAGSGGCTNSQNNVAIYAQGSDLPTVVADGLDFPLAIAVDGSNNLYVANDGSSSKRSRQCHRLYFWHTFADPHGDP